MDDITATIMPAGTISSITKYLGSKWEKKEDTLKEDISKSWVLLGHDSKRLDYVIKYFKQRIEESLEKADKETRESLLDITKNSFGLINTVKKHLGWILD